MVISTSWEVSEVSVVIETIDKRLLTSFFPSVPKFSVIKHVAREMVRSVWRCISVSSKLTERCMNPLVVHITRKAVYLFLGVYS